MHGCVLFDILPNEIFAHSYLILITSYVQGIISDPFFGDKKLNCQRSRFLCDKTQDTGIFIKSGVVKYVGLANSIQPRVRIPTLAVQAVCF